MARQYHLRCWTRFRAPADEVWAYKTNAANLDAERAPLLRLALPDPVALTQALRGLGSQPLDGRLWWGGVLPGPRWPVQVRVDPADPHRITETSPDNPLFQEWTHVRTLEEAADAVRYMDAVTFAPRLPATRLVARAVEELFIHAHKQSARRFETDARATAVAMLRVVPTEEERWQE
ncbi:MAG: hypothetical protein H6739_10585 [Alphaproteobacteria bacterium]|nr:hypothetical protein [Alphaproteobacteria bacterium]